MWKRRNSQIKKGNEEKKRENKKKKQSREREREKKKKGFSLLSKIYLKGRRFSSE